MVTSIHPAEASLDTLIPCQGLGILGCSVAHSDPDVHFSMGIRKAVFLGCFLSLATFHLLLCLFSHPVLLSRSFSTRRTRASTMSFMSP